MELVNLLFAKKVTIHQNAITQEVSNSFAVPSRAGNDTELLDTAAENNHMEVEEPLPVTNCSISGFLEVCNRKHQHTTTVDLASCQVLGVA